MKNILGWTLAILITIIVAPIMVIEIIFYTIRYFLTGKAFNDSMFTRFVNRAERIADKNRE